MRDDMLASAARMVRAWWHTQALCEIAFDPEPRPEQRLGKLGSLRKWRLSVSGNFVFGRGSPAL